MNAVVTPLEPFSTSNQQNPFIFCDGEDYGSDGISYEHSGYSFESIGNDERNTVLPLSFHASGEAKRKCAPIFCMSSDETTATMAQDDAINSKSGLSTEGKSGEIFNDSSTSTTSTSGNDRSDENECEKDENESTSRKTDGVSHSAEETDAKPDVQIEICFFKTSHSGNDSPDNDKGEKKAKLVEDYILDEPSSGAVTKKRDNRRNRSKKSTEKKWKQLDAKDMGFHLSSFPRLPNESKSELNDECKTLETSTEVSNNESVVETGVKCSDKDSTEADPSVSCERESDREAPDNEELDDVAFFASLGVDVRDSGDAFHGDDIWEWDGVRYDNSSGLHSVSSKGSTNTKQTSDTAMKPWPSGSQCKKSVRDSHVISNKYVCNMSKRDVGILFDSGCVSSMKTYLRPDRHRRQMKCHKAVKSKQAKVSDVFHNPSKKQLYMHHRLIKLLNIDVDFFSASVPRRNQPTAMPKIKVSQDWIKGIRVKNCRPSAGQSAASQHVSAPKPQNLNHALAETNVPADFAMDLVSFLLSVQHRELTPEDYEMLLRLDDSVKAKTVSKNVLDSLKTETIGEGDIIDTMCTICMEPYIAGQVRKFLPCQHDFHNECIDTWLNNSSQNCPLDGLPVDGS